MRFSLFPYFMRDCICIMYLGTQHGLVAGTHLAFHPSICELKAFPEVALKGGCWCKYVLYYLHLLKFTQVNALVIYLHYFIHETLRSLCTHIELLNSHRSLHHSLSCHVDNKDISTPHVAHVVNNTDLRAPPLQAYLHIIALNPVLNGG